MIDSGIGERILGARAVATGSPDGDSLENVNTTTLDDGSRCYVFGGPGAGEWQWQSSATDTADGTTIVEPVAGGAGRWFKKASPGVPAAVPEPLYSFFIVSGFDLSGSPDRYFFDPTHANNYSNGAFQLSPNVGTTSFDVVCLESGVYDITFIGSIGFPTNSGPATVSSYLYLDGAAITTAVPYVRTAGDPSITRGLGVVGAIHPITAGQIITVPSTVAFAGTPDTAAVASGSIRLIKLNDLP